jgi:tetratricopeptide (TPR) repeat protein
MLFFCFTLITSLCIGQTAQQEQIIQEIKRQFEQGNIYEAEMQALKALNSDIEFSSENLCTVHNYLAFCYVALGDKANAIKEFLKSLEINPNQRFNPQLISPKIIEVFNLASEEYQRQQKIKPIDSKQTLEKAQIKASKRSLIFPGLGQLYKGNKTKGYLFIGGESLSLLSITVFQWQYQKTHEAYLKATLPNDIEKKYKDYDLYYKLRNLSIGMSAAIYVVSYFDAIYSKPYAQKKLSVQFIPLNLTIVLNL